ncbi:UNVERIFIED_CONTAM: protein ENHANCED DOWNY MILDEW 2 [Sesamum latifolium]|uniref:Protein ENHANCED DOWNY MILDEW 2 n=1 Tax=Sesamum latifolium TaxID=2727402 RepID=A0AAW2WP62_9LAMI
MASSDDEGETVANNVSDYEFISGDDESVPFTELPVEWNKGETHDGKPQQIFLCGKTDNGLRKIYKQVISWKFVLLREKPEISVLSVEGSWIKLLKPRKAYHEMIRTIQITVHFLHFVKWNPQLPQKALWDRLNKTFSMFERRPSEDDLVDHKHLINEAVKRDEALANSKILNTFLEEKPRKRKPSNEDVKPSFIVENVNGNEDQEESDKTDENADDENGDDESDEDDCFDSVCAICDNGGHIYICEGKCMRSFHATVEDGEESNCESLGFTDAELEAIKNVPFYCKNCEYKKHQCFACGELGSSDESSGAEVFCCVNGACGHFYHPHCVAKLLHPGNRAAAQDHERRIAAGEQFACPAHKCYVCNELEVRSNLELQFAVCRRCPRAYHRKCLPSDIPGEKDLDEAGKIIQRAWDGLIPNRVLIYCLEHEIDPDFATPVRDHIKFPGSQQKKLKKLPLESSKRKDSLKERPPALEGNVGKRVSVKPPKGFDKVYSSAKQGDLSRKRVEKLPAQESSKKQKVATNRNDLEKSKESATDEGEISLGDRLYATFCGMDSEPEKSSRGENVLSKLERMQKAKPVVKTVNDFLTLDADNRKRILTLMKDASSSITLDQVKRRHQPPSTHSQYSKFSADNITMGKVEGAVQAVRAALKKLDEGGSVQDAKAVCGNDLLVQLLRWKEKLKVYLAPFLYGMRYTSFGRHFTKMDKLKEVVDVLHWYVQDGDMLVDFACGSNDFSCLMKEKLDEMGKRCSFKNFDTFRPKNDFSFERRDWTGVKRDELPDGSQLIIGLNPPFGVNAALANKFINKALEFRPKLLILIVPRETQRLDEKGSPYDLIWEDDQMFVGKAFYLPGSVDVNDKQIEDWNVNAPVLYLWSCPDWTPKHKAIAEQHGHLSGAQKKDRTEESHDEMHVPESLQECHILDEPIVNKGEDVHQGKSENGEQQGTVTKSHQEGLPHDSSGAEWDKNGATGKDHSAENSKKFGGKRKKKRKSDNMFLEDKSKRRPISCNPSPNMPDRRSLETYSPKHLETPFQVHSGRNDFQQYGQRNFSTHRPYSETGYNGNQEWYNLSGAETRPSMTGMHPHAPSPIHEYGFRASSDQWIGHPEERTNSFANVSYMGEMNEKYDREVSIRSHVNFHRSEELSSFGQRTVGPSYPGPGFPSPYGRLNPAADSTYGGMNTSAMQRYAPRLDELNHARMSNTVPGPLMRDASGSYHPPLHKPHSELAHWVLLQVHTAPSLTRILLVGLMSRSGFWKGPIVACGPPFEMYIPLVQEGDISTSA